VQELSVLAQARGLRLETPTDSAAAAGLWASADDLRLRQVLRNVLTNAIHFAPEGSAITLTWRRSGSDDLLISVRDQGPGIPEGELESIFESFVQSSRTKDGSGGTGLGLTISRRIMAAHQGSIRAHNHPQGGAVFEIRLPALTRQGSRQSPADALT
jgi:signal transduction histidine kinase